jgi:hypothetical protein
LLPHANTAIDDSSLEHESKCHSETRVQLLQDIEDWSEDSQDQPIFWLKGLAGTGKSTVARTIASRFHAKQRLGACFFFARGHGDRGHAKTFFTTVAFQLSKLSETLGYTISEAIRTNPEIINKNFQEQWRHLIHEPLERCPLPDPIVVVIDALDECDSEQGEQDVQKLLRVIAQVKDIHACSLRFFITSRPEVPVKHGFDSMRPYVKFYDYALHEMDDPVVERDITVYLTSELGNINRKYSSSNGDWPSQEEICRLAGQAGKFFIYAATACRFIDQGGSSLFKERLADILEGDPDGSEEIDKMYNQVLEYSVRNFRPKDKLRFSERFRCMVGTTVVLLSPLTAAAMKGLLSESSQTAVTITAETIHSTLSPFGSILAVPESEQAPISLFHLSFRDFLLSEERCKNKEFWISEEKAHGDLVDCCLKLMLARLKRDICNLQEPGFLTKDISDQQRQSGLSADLQYACQYWVQHLKRSKAQLEDNGKVHSFLQQNLLHWFEALSLMGKMSEGVYAVILLESMVRVSYASTELGI